MKRRQEKQDINITELKRIAQENYDYIKKELLQENLSQKKYLDIVTNLILPVEVIKTEPFNLSYLKKWAKTHYIDLNEYFSDGNKYLTDKRILIVDEKINNTFKNKYWHLIKRKYIRDYVKAGIEKGKATELAIEYINKQRQKGHNLFSYEQVLSRIDLNKKEYTELESTGLGFWHKVGILSIPDPLEILYSANEDRYIIIEKMYIDFIKKVLGKVKYLIEKEGDLILAYKDNEVKIIMLRYNFEGFYAGETFEEVVKRLRVKPKVLL